MMGKMLYKMTKVFKTRKMRPYTEDSENLDELMLDLCLYYNIISTITFW